MANLLTGSRILFAAMLVFCPAFSVLFYVFYLLGAFTDMVDGTIARALNQASPFGAKLDTFADYVFIIVVLVKVLVAVYIPQWLWIWIIVITLLKIANVICGYVMCRKFVAEHTIMNKITGFLLFLLPLGMGILPWQGMMVAVGVSGGVATFAAIQEGHYIRIGKAV